MRYFIIKIFESSFLTFSSTFILFLLLTNSIDYSYSPWDPQKNFLHWIGDLLNGDLLTYTPSDKLSTDNLVIGSENFSIKPVPIEIFSNTSNSVGQIFLKTLRLSILCLFLGMALSLLLNTIIIFKTGVLSKIAKYIEMTLSLVSSVHIIILALFFNKLKLVDFDNIFFSELILYFLIICGSNVFYNLSSKQYLTLITLKKSDYILASKAWGDSSLSQMKRTIMLMLLTQFTTMFSTILTNTVIIEIIFQKIGLGFEIYNEIFSNEYYPDIGRLIAISFLLIFVVQLINISKQSIEKILINYR